MRVDTKALKSEAEIRSLKSAGEQCGKKEENLDLD